MMFKFARMIFSKIKSFFKMLIDFNNRTKTTNDNMGGFLKALKFISDTPSHLSNLNDRLLILSINIFYIGCIVALVYVVYEFLKK